MAVPGLVHRGVSFEDSAMLAEALLPVLERAARAGDVVTLALDRPTADVVRAGLGDRILAAVDFLDPDRPARSHAFQLAARRATAAATAAREGLRTLLVTQYQPGLGLGDASWLRLRRRWTRRCAACR